ncbi:MAG: RES domain-containing protein [Acidobacteriaceae bacterium]|nr:RES domain-containing protein [Acidobacteriaceae bacterium]
MPEPSGIYVGDRRLCSHCISERFLRRTVENNGIKETCLYCEQQGNTISIKELSDLVQEVLQDFYTWIESLSTEENKIVRATWGQPIGDVINDLVGAGNAVAEDIRQVLEQRQTDDRDQWDFEGAPFNPHARYAKNRPPDANELELSWRLYEHRLKTQTRYFNRSAEELLVSIFDGMENRQTIDGRPIVIEAGPGKALLQVYRARVFQKEKEFRAALKRPHVEIGPPPPPLASGGRMNAAGISVFYAATTPALALAEVRPPVGSKVLIGCFQVIRPLKLLDLIALTDLADEEGSLFDKLHINHLRRAEFLRGLGERLSRPVMPNDQPLEYLPTQAVADFLASDLLLSLDGILYPSVQNAQFRRAQRRYRPFGGIDHNVVLFHKASQVAALDEGEQVDVSDGSFLFYDSETFEHDPNVSYYVGVSPPNDADTADDVALRLINLEARYIAGVQFDAEPIQTLRVRRSVL